MIESFQGLQDLLENKTECMLILRSIFYFMKTKKIQPLLKKKKKKRKKDSTAPQFISTFRFLHISKYVFNRMCGMIVEANHTIMIQNAVTPLGWVFPDPKINSLGLILLRKWKMRLVINDNVQKIISQISTFASSPPCSEGQRVGPDGELLRLRSRDSPRLRPRRRLPDPEN